ncbi:DUF1476 domain-containing protein [Candidatus Odyssella acanthamoebae]|uniref:Aldolase n=1 Tax=Candidatus Odyssella acanthamoebae TaxID=91604 RepID=A0A077AWI4_9PROT|nr:DUF1476 domain-containing protein [Candidatus Paracaedibacter acanthamoebae]AIK96806.1 hypothetical protein ID47_08800 [Candidatus Paracaedibacter acanthamoebae]
MPTVHLTGSKEKIAEQRYANQEKHSFDINVKRDHTVGLWAAEIFGYDDEKAKRYAKEVIVADLEEPGDEDIIRKLIADFETHGISMTRQEIEKQLLLAEEKIKSQQ